MSNYIIYVPHKAITHFSTPTTTHTFTHFGRVAVEIYLLHMLNNVSTSFAAHLVDGQQANALLTIMGHVLMWQHTNDNNKSKKRQ